MSIAEPVSYAHYRRSGKKHLAFWRAGHEQIVGQAWAGYSPFWKQRWLEAEARPVIAEQPTSSALEVGIVLERIWAPWRAQYVKEGALLSSSGTSCFLCDAWEGSDDHASLLAWRRPHSMVMLNRFPYNNGHLLVAPRVHKGQIEELTGADLFEPIETIRSMIVILDRMLRPQGYNVGLNLGKAAGAGFPEHLHWHIVPRWDGDTNFMPVLTHTKVIVESLNEFHLRLVEEIRAAYGPA